MYDTIIDDVIRDVEVEFENEGVDPELVEELRAVRGGRFVATMLARSPPPPPPPRPLAWPRVAGKAGDGTRGHGAGGVGRGCPAAGEHGRVRRRVRLKAGLGVPWDGGACRGLPKSEGAKAPTAYA